MDEAHGNTPSNGFENDVERCDELNVSNDNLSTVKDDSMDRAESHQYGNTILSDCARAVLGNVSYVYNFYGSAERVASYRRSAASCFQEIVDDVLPSRGNGMDAESQGLKGSANSIDSQDFVINLQLAEEALATDIEKANGDLENLRITELAFHALYKPTEIVTKHKSGEVTAYKIDAVRHVASNAIELKFWTWNFDGHFYKSHDVVVVTHPGLQVLLPIESLDFKPLRLSACRQRSRLESRGAKFWSLRHRRLIEYHATPADDSTSRQRNRRYMVDMSAYSELHPGSSSASPYHGEATDTISDTDDDPAADTLVLLPAQIKGFGFHDKRWRTLSVQNIMEVEWDKHCLKKFALDPDEKELISALVSEYTAKSGQGPQGAPQDKGLKLLFYGPPGTGKTLAAECIAELIQRPFYSMTASDTGGDPANFEKYLESALYIGTMWGCVMLLDDADLFLEQRTHHDIQRNALVSVFLRVLDRFEGVLIFTTNRIGTFDESIKSRVRLPVYFPALREEQRRIIWENFFSVLEERDVNVGDLHNYITEFAKVDFNGRQIWSVIDTARRWAAYQKAEFIPYALISKVIKMTANFDKAMRGISHFECQSKADDNLRIVPLLFCLFYVLNGHFLH